MRAGGWHRKRLRGDVPPPGPAHRSPSLTIATNEDHAGEETVSAGPSGRLLSRTGMAPVDMNAGAHSTQVPPLPSL